MYIGNSYHIAAMSVEEVGLGAKVGGIVWLLVATVFVFSSV